MQRDVAAGRPSEFHDQTGTVVRLGEEAGVPVPVHRFLRTILSPQEAAARSARPG
jgi:2-dehydropantoate 2-reductase